MILALVMALALVACGNKNTDDGKKDNPDDNKTPTVITNPDKVQDEMTSSDGKYEVAFVTDVGQLKDKSFNQGTYDGVKLYAANNGLSYKYYQPANGSEATDDDRFTAMKAAVDNGAKVVVCAGFMQTNALRMAASQFTDVSFVYIDGDVIRADAEDKNSAILTNVAGVAFKEEQCGYLAGYAAVKEGYTKLGFTGGGGGDNPALQTMAAGWYQAGTEVIFACGGSMFASVAAAAGADEGKVIGVDVDQSFESTTVITSAMKGLADSVQWALGKFYAGEFASIGGVQTSLGANENAVGLPTATWSLTKWSVDDYNTKLQEIKDGKIAIDNNYDNLASTENVTLNIVG